MVLIGNFRIYKIYPENHIWSVEILKYVDHLFISSMHRKYKSKHNTYSVNSSIIKHGKHIEDVQIVKNHTKLIK